MNKDKKKMDEKRIEQAKKTLPEIVSADKVDWHNPQLRQFLRK